MNHNNQFQSLPTTIKGNLAELYVVDYLESIGYTLWWNTNNKPTVYDGLGYSGQTGQVRNLFEVKTKTKTKYGSYSIHQNDLVKYKQAEIDENKKMIIIYLDPSTAELNVTSIKAIEQSTKRLVWDEKEKKYLVYFDGFKTKATVPQSVCDSIKQVKI